MWTWLKHPARLVPLSFLAVILLGTGALMLPLAKADAGSAPFLTALFVATSAVAVTGLSTVDTATYWSGLGQGVIWVLFHLGGFGIMSAATLLGMVVSRRLGLSRQMMVQAEARGIAAGDVKSVLTFMALVALVVEGVMVAGFYLLLIDAPDTGSRLWHAVFLAGASFTNAGFAIHASSLSGDAGNPALLVLVMAGIVIGGLGLPVLHELRHSRRASWSLHLRLTLWGSLALTLGGAAAVLVFEWGNPATLGALDWSDRVVGALFHSVNTRSCGLAAFDTGAISEETMMVSYALMVVGAGSASMGGGIKVTTLMVVLLAVWTELRGDPEVQAFGRRISPTVLRQALVVTALAVGVLMLATMVLRLLSDQPLERLIFEAISAFGNVGLSMGITADLPPAAQGVIILLMYLGRVGIVTVATGLALRSRKAEFRYPEERPIVG
jgi:trk system potassium uptake protein